MIKLFYGEELLGELMSSRSLGVDETIEELGIDMDEIAEEKKWDDWDYEELRVELA